MPENKPNKPNKPEPKLEYDFNSLNQTDRKRSRAIAQALGAPPRSGHAVLSQMSDDEIETLDQLMDPTISQPGPDNMKTRIEFINAIVKRTGVKA